MRHLFTRIAAIALAATVMFAIPASSYCQSSGSVHQSAKSYTGKHKSAKSGAKKHKSKSGKKHRSKKS